jgi:hypothetical protein
MIDNLTWPLVAKGMENRDAKGDAVDVITEEAPLQAASMHLATDIIQNAHSHLRGDVLE